MELEESNEKIQDLNADNLDTKKNIRVWDGIKIKS